jgi:RND family efflux transporter MFP subunit
MQLAEKHVAMNPLSLEQKLKKSLSETQPAAPRSHGRRWLLVIVLAVVAGIGAWYVHGWSIAADGSTAEGGGGKAERAKLGFIAVDGAVKDKNMPAAARIEVVPLEIARRGDVLRLTGSLIADERSSVAANTSGIAAEVRVDRGSLVRKDDVLVQIDATDAKSKLAEGQAMLDELKARLGLDENVEKYNPEDQPEVRLAKAAADLAASNLKRAREMQAKKVVSAEAYDQTLTDYELAVQRYRQSLRQIKQAFRACQTAEIKLRILEKAVADTTIRAPFDGWVAEKLVAVGEQISSGMQATKVVTLVRIDPLRLSLTVPQQDIGCIQPGQPVHFRVDSFPDRTFEARVRFIAPVVTNDTRSMVVEAVAPNPDGALRPGLFATAELELACRQQCVYAPLGAVQKTGEVARVFVVRDGVAREQVVALGEEKHGKIEIRAGLTGKELLVARPELVQDGDKVK